MSVVEHEVEMIKMLYLTTSRHFRPVLNEVNNTYRAAYAATLPGVELGGPGFHGTSPKEVLYLPAYVEEHFPHVDAVFIADPWHNFWDPCDDYPNCPPLVIGIDDVDKPVIIESGDSQFYYEETCAHLMARPQRGVAIRALSHAWRFDPSLETALPRSMPTFYLPHGAYPEMVEGSRGVEKTIDILVSGDLGVDYPARKRVDEALRQAPDLNVFRLSHPSVTGHRIVGPAFWQLIAKSRLALAGTNMFGNLTMRYLEIPACGSLAIGDVPLPEGEHDPWADHMVNIGDLDADGIADLLRVTLSSPDLLAAKSAAAQEFVLSHHTFRQEMLRVFKEIRRWLR